MRKALFILAELEDRDLLWLVESGRRRTIAAGTTLIAAGGEVTELSILVEGQLDVILPPDKIIGELLVGDIIGEMSLIEKRPPEVSLLAAEETRLLSLPHEAVRRRLADDQGFAARFYRALAVMLADRLRTRVARLARSEQAGEGDADAFARESELDEGILDNLHVAGERMRRLLRLLEEERG
ncbi:cyclic nucleotide-binding domain-containing protein [Thiorhodococcus mannitoliphagus]|uniref:Cyclic nucleotide-binding domain-containing protein n=1 Tax=Thiorhodococcus mannitoliphagus TaxID=329406 RepID=A0A6P1DVK2_9GAMM|nr:cyclic nucleotide-binding domain-containing protein [Thiorhodococcus mannitoliphagus]NEX19724.1 cyclic nucleotide-binding domain-containing protein [Thiorhodococcus mannitoliphagus]